MSDLIQNWSPEQKTNFGKSPMVFDHRLGSTGLFEDEALERLLDVYPAELFDINLFDFDADGQASMRTGARGRLPGKDVLAGVKEGRIWVQLRGAESWYPELRKAIHDVFAGISEQVEGFRPVQLTGQLIISAPSAKVPFHADAPGVVLFHIRGRKRIWIYPSDETHMPQRGMENIMLKQQTEDLPYQRDMDAAARVFDLEPGQAVTWPLHAPHRIENQGVFNVSLSVDYQTWNTRMINGAHYTNGVLRRWGMPVAPMRKTPVPARAMLWGASLGLKRVPLFENKIKAFERSFELGQEAAAQARP